MNYQTQASSKARLKNDTLGDDALKRLYAYYNDLPFDRFKMVCECMVQMGGGKQLMKDQIISAIRLSTKKEVALKKTQDFILAGMGLGV